MTPSRVFLAAIVGLAASISIGAQSFGQNKVQYQNLDWRYIETPHVQVFYHQSQEQLPSISAAWIEDDYRSLSRKFGFTHRKRVPLLLFGSPNQFEQTNVILDNFDADQVGGFTEMLKTRVVVPFSGSWAEHRHVLHHELVHAFEFGILYDQIGGSLLRSANLQLPLWFAEGLAEYLSVGWDVESDMFLMDRAVYGQLAFPDGPYADYMVYKGGQSFLYFLAAGRGDKAFDRFLRGFRDTKSPGGALEETFDESQEDLAAEWVRELKRIYWPEIGRREDPSRIAGALTFHEKWRSHFNLQPRISPDGSKVAYFSDKKDDTRIIVCDRTGKTLAEIPQIGYAGYFESFHPFRSGMCWSPESDRLAFVTKANGRDEIRVLRVASKRVERVVRPTVKSISSPDWSHDGRYLVFAGLDGHQTDLYTYDIENDSLQRRTKSIAFEADPRFSPDGKTVVFSLQDSAAGVTRTSPWSSPSMDLCVLDLARDSVGYLTRTPCNEKQPCFSGDGTSIVYVCDKNGIDNLYMTSLTDTGVSRPLTDVIGGCSNPDWSWHDSSLVFCLFQKQGWDVWLIDDVRAKLKTTELTPTRWVQSWSDSTCRFFLPAAPHDSTTRHRRRSRAHRDSTDVGLDTASLTVTADSSTHPVSDSSRSDTSATADTAETIGADSAHVEGASPAGADIDSVEVVGGSTSSTPELEAPVKDTIAPIDYSRSPRLPYKPKFSPDVIAVGLAASPQYGYGGQGVVVLSDLMGDHRISLSGDIQGNPKDYAHLFGYYACLKYRTDFGIGGFFDRNYTWARALYHDTRLGALGQVTYPFSQWLRADLGVYYSNVTRVPVDVSPDESDTIDPQPLPRTRRFDILTPSLSLVFDNITWGITGPLNGTRADATLMVSPPLSTVDQQFASLEVDIRKYIHIRKRFVWANRLTFGGSVPLGSGDTPRHYYLGGDENWLMFTSGGIDLNNYIDYLDHDSYSEVVVPFRGWKYFDKQGTRFAVLNTEFRFPFIREVAVAWPAPFTIRYINGAVFADAGNAWSPQNQIRGIPLPHDIYGGVGFGLRANLGIFVARFDRAWRTDWHTYLAHPMSYFCLGAEF